MPGGLQGRWPFWCFEPVCESGRTLLLEQRSVAFRRKAGEHEEECLVTFLRPRLAAEGALCRYYIPAVAVSSGGKRLSNRVRKGNRWLRRALCQSAWAASRKKNSFLAAFFYRRAAKQGLRKAIMVLAHRLLVIAFCVLRDGTEYNEKGDYFDLLNPERTRVRLVRRLQPSHRTPPENADAPVNACNAQSPVNTEFKIQKFSKDSEIAWAENAKSPDFLRALCVQIGFGCSTLLAG